MTLVEFLEMELQERYKYLFGGNNAGFKCFRYDDTYKYSLWDCGTFYVEVQRRKTDRKITRVDGLTQEDDRINLYLDFINEHKDDEIPD